MSSIRRQLLAGLLAAVTVAGLAGAGWTFVVARQEANALFDYHLEQMAWSLRDHALQRGALPPTGIERENDFVIQIWTRDGVEIYLSRPHTVLPAYAKLGFADVPTSEGTWRVFSAQVRDRVIQVAQPQAVRERLAASLALRTALPFALVVPFLALLVWVVVGRGLSPLDRVAKAVRARQPASLAPIDATGLPEEIAPLVAELDALLGRLGEALESQRRFLADAAHELRTPLAALSLQIQLAERATEPAAREATLAELRRGVARATRVVEQLLTLARQAPEARAPFEPVDLAEIARSVVAEQASLAVERGLDLGIGEAHGGAVSGDPEGLRALVRNLVDNAIRYTPRGGSIDVDVGVREGHPFLTVTDTGPGIPAAERDRVFDRFYRGAGREVVGSGLGLAIVKEVADRHGASIALDDRPGGGLVVRVTFPAAL